MSRDMIGVAGKRTLEQARFRVHSHTSHLGGKEDHIINRTMAGDQVVHRLAISVEAFLCIHKGGGGYL